MKIREDIEKAIGNMEHIIRICEEYKKTIRLLSEICCLQEYTLNDPKKSTAKQIKNKMEEAAYIATKRVHGFLTEDDIRHTYYPIKKLGANYIHLKTKEIHTLVRYREKNIEMEKKLFMHEDYFNEFYRLVEEE